MNKNVCNKDLKVNEQFIVPWVLLYGYVKRKHVVRFWFIKD